MATVKCEGIEFEVVKDIVTIQNPNYSAAAEEEVLDHDAVTIMVPAGCKRVTIHFSPKPLDSTPPPAID